MEKTISIKSNPTKEKIIKDTSKKNIANPSILSFKEVLRVFSDSSQNEYINSTMQKTNIKWIYLYLTSVLLLETVTGFKALSIILKENIFIKYSFIIILALQVYQSILYININKNYSYSKTNEYLSLFTLLTFIIFQCFFYAAGSISNQTFFYFISAVIALSLFPSIHIKYISLSILLNNILFVFVIYYFDYSNSYFRSAFINSFYISLIGVILSYNFFNSKVNLIINNKKINIYIKEMNEANNELNYLNDKLEKLSLTDTLTKISNRRSFDLELQKIWNHSIRSGASVSILLIDIDHFKNYNDYFGHPEGDKCLIKIAKCLRSCFKRNGDIVARVGGEEFAIILSSVNLEQAMFLANRILSSVNDLKIPHPKNIVSDFVTVSIGVTSVIPSLNINSSKVYTMADIALYKAKNSGKNKACSNINSNSDFDHDLEPKNNNNKPKEPEPKKIFRPNSLFAFDLYPDTKAIVFYNKLLDFFQIPKTSPENFEKLEKHIHKEDIKRLEEFYNNLISKNADNTFIEFRFIKEDNTFVWVRCICELITDKHKSINHIVGAIMDITKEVKNKLIVEEILDGFYYYDFRKNSGTIYGRILDFLGISKNEVSADFNVLIKSIHKDDKEKLFEQMETINNLNIKNSNIEYRIFDKSNNPKWFSARNIITHDASGQPVGMISSLSNLELLHTYNNFMKGHTRINQTSGLPDKLMFYEDLNSILSINTATGFLFMIDIDNFSNINNIFSYSIGNQFLQHFGKLLKKNILFFGKVYHYDADLFVITFPNMTEKEASVQLEHLKKMSSKPILCKNTNYQYTLSLSCIEYPRFGKTAEEIFTNADVALHKVKVAGGNATLIFTKNLHDENNYKLNSEIQLRNSVSNNMEGFYIHYHPLLSADTNKCIGAEALLRWTSPDNTTIPPNIFIPILEESGLMTQVGDWVFKAATNQCKKWLSNGLEFENENKTYNMNKNFAVNINVSAHQLAEDYFEDNILNHLEKINLDCKHVVLELTESALIMDIQTGVTRLNLLRQEGVKIAIDDFGTGYSSLSYFRDLPVDEIKIDRSFVKNIENDQFSKEFVNSIIKLTQTTDRVICVEGVETESQAKILKDFNANILQGFLFSKPIPEDEFERRFFLNC